MLHLRILAPPELAGRVVSRLEEMASVINVARLAGAAVKPRGDVVLCDVAREDGSVVLDALREMRVDVEGSISVHTVDVAISRAADLAEAAAAGSPSDAVVWEEVEAQTAASAEITIGYLVLMVLATAIAAIGILSDSVVLVIGAMVVGPEFGPVAGLCVAIVQRRPRLALRSFTALLVGFPFAIVLTWLLVVGLVATGIASATLVHRQTSFISHPDEYAVLIACIAGVAGVVSLTTAKSGALVGVLISVTTIPAAANIAVAAVYGRVDEIGGASAQLGLNLASIVAAGVLTLAVQRHAFVRRLRAALRTRRAQQLARARDAERWRPP